VKTNSFLLLKMTVRERKCGGRNERGVGKYKNNNNELKQ
jgi:hypothetical protein